VVNVITRNPENGYTGGASVQNATLTGFVNGFQRISPTREAKILLGWITIWVSETMITETITALTNIF